MSSSAMRVCARDLSSAAGALEFNFSLLLNSFGWASYILSTGICNYNRDVGKSYRSQDQEPTIWSRCQDRTDETSGPNHHGNEIALCAPRLLLAMRNLGVSYRDWLLIHG